MVSPAEAEAQLYAWGFRYAMTCVEDEFARMCWPSNPIQSPFEPHTHRGAASLLDTNMCSLPLSLDFQPESRPVATTHFILDGLLTIAYPHHPDPNVRGQQFTYGVGDRIDVPAGRIYELWAGPWGCTRVIGTYYQGPVHK
jgi:hypothetical protein